MTRLEIIATACASRFDPIALGPASGGVFNLSGVCGCATFDCFDIPSGTGWELLVMALPRPFSDILCDTHAGVMTAEVIPVEVACFWFVEELERAKDDSSEESTTG